MTSTEAITDIGFIEALHEDSVKLQFEEGDEGNEAFLTWYLVDLRRR